MSIVRIWRCELDRITPRSHWLDERELATAAGFVFEHDRLRYLAAHTALRQVLGECMDLPPQSLVFEVGSAGKPMLCSQGHGRTPHFNLSHGSDVAYIAVSSEAEVGVDVELVRAVPDVWDLAATAFSLLEIEALKRCSPDELSKAFLHCWTRKEAYLKALGAGVAEFDLRDVTVGIGCDVELEPAGSVGTGARIYVRTLETPSSECAAVALWAPIAAIEWQTLHLS